MTASQFDVRSSPKADIRSPGLTLSAVQNQTSRKSIGARLCIRKQQSGANHSAEPTLIHINAALSIADDFLPDKTVCRPICQPFRPPIGAKTITEATREKRSRMTSWSSMNIMPMRRKRARLPISSKTLRTRVSADGSVDPPFGRGGKVTDSSR